MPTKTSLNLALIAALFGLAACNTTKAPAPSPAETKPAAAVPAPVAADPASSKPIAVVEPAPMTKQEARAARKAAAKAAAAEAKADAKKVGKVSPPAAKSDTATPVTAPVAEVKPVVEVKPAAPKTGAVTQDQAMALAKKGNCLACHKIDSKLVGPAWKDVGAKYKGDATTIAANIKKGGKFGWNLGMMPPKGGSSLSDADIASLAGFIATLK